MNEKGKEELTTSYFNQGRENCDFKWIRAIDERIRELEIQVGIPELKRLKQKIPYDWKESEELTGILKRIKRANKQIGEKKMIITAQEIYVAIHSLEARREWIDDDETSAEEELPPITSLLNKLKSLNFELNKLEKTNE